MSTSDASTRPRSPIFSSESDTWQLPHIDSVKLVVVMGADKTIFLFPFSRKLGALQRSKQRVEP